MFFVFCILNIVLFLIFDSIWFKISGNFFKEQMGSILRLKDGNFDVRMKAAVVVYILMAFSVEYFVFYAFSPVSILEVVKASAPLGLITFGVYDFTNRSVLISYPFKLALVDTSWGVVIYSLVSTCSFFIKSFL